MGHYSRPKPLIEIQGRPMVAWALDSLKNVEFEKMVFVVLEEHEQEFGVTKILKNVVPGCEIVFLPEVTNGQLCTVLAARDYLANAKDVLICPSDTLIKSCIGEDIRNRAGDCEGIISVMDMPGERWSFARVGGDGKVLEVAEKRRISNHASTGFYYFSRASEFLDLGDALVREKEQTCGEYYVIPVYQRIIDRGGVVNLSLASEMYDMGSEEAKVVFERHLRTHE